MVSKDLSLRSGSGGLSRSFPASCRVPDVSGRLGSDGDGIASAFKCSYLGLLGNLQSIVYLHASIPR